MHLRRLTAADSFDALTALLHAAYAPLAAQGMRFSATHQRPEVTRQRAQRGECWVGEIEGEIVSTVTIVPPNTGGSCDFFRKPGVARLNQMAVHPKYKGLGYGRQLIAHAEQRALALGARELALDTAIHARALHALYNRHGYRVIGPADWRPHTNYLSIVMSKALGTESLAGTPVGWDRDRSDAWRDNPAEVRAVLGAVFPGLPEKLDLAEKLGYRWPEVSTAHLVDDAAHVGVLEVATLIDGRQVAIAGVHAVATVPSARGKGKGRAAMERALRYVDKRLPASFLTTEIPDYFVPFGFRIVPEHRFRVLPALSVGGAPPLRRLSHEIPEDLALVRRTLEGRTEISRRLSVQELGWFFTINEVLAHGGFGSLWAADDLGAIVSWQRDGDRAQVFDILSREPLPLAEIAARLPGDLSGIDLWFCPDRIDVPTEPVLGSPDGSALMVRGDLALPQPIAWPLHARC